MRFLRRVGPYVVLILLVCLGVLLFWQHDRLLDYLWSRGYHPTRQVAQLTVDTTMTPYAERLFFANRPVIEGKVVFNKNCTNNTNDQVSTLGCYTGNRRGIYLYDVTDPRLSGVEQVTAAHEMLHQAYDRLGRSERRRINLLLQTYYDNLTDQSIIDQMATYEKSEPKDLLNEMHSIFGTQVANLPAELQTYYSRYFSNRAKIVTYYQQYQSEFEMRRKQVDTYDQQLSVLKVEIDGHKASLDSRGRALNDERVQLDAYLHSNQIVEYNALVPGFNTQVNAYRAEVTTTNNLITQYNAVLDARNAIAIQERELQQALDSHIQSATRR